MKLKLKNIISASIALSIAFSGIATAQTSGYEGYGHAPSSMQADIKSERIPAGTTLKLLMTKAVNSYNSNQGDDFRASLLDDIRIGTRVVLPQGTMIRGSVSEVKKNAYLSRGGIMALNFDHVVTSMGKTLPINAKVVNSKYLTPEGKLSAGGGYFNACANGLEDGSDFLVKSTEYGIEKGKSTFRGYPVILTVPVGAAVGLVGAAGIFTVKSTVALFKKGDNVRINPNDTIDILLKEPLDVPLN